MKKQSKWKEWIMAGVVAPLIVSLILYLVGLFKSEHKFFGETQIRDEYYLLLADTTNLTVAEKTYSDLKLLSKLSLELDTIPDDTIYLWSSKVNIGFGEDQVVLARSLSNKNKYIVGLDLLKGQGEPEVMKQGVSLVKERIKKRINNIQREFTNVQDELKDKTETVKRLLLTLKELLENSKMEFYSNTDYRKIYGVDIPK